MRKPSPPRSALDSDTDNTPDAEALESMRLPDGQIPYPETAAWTQLGVTVRRAAALRQQARQRQFRLRVWMCSAAAALVLLLGAGALLWQGPPPEAAAAARVVHGTPSRVMPPADSVAAELARVAGLTQQLELDYLALELAREGLAGPDTGSDVIGQILAAHKVDTVAVYLAAQQN